MKLNNVRNYVTSKVGRQILVAQKHSPTILFVGGIAGVITTTVLASRATLRLDDVLLETQKRMDQAHEVRKDFPEKYSELDLKKDMTHLYVLSAMKITKLYGPSILVGIASIAALTGSHKILNNRVAGVTAAYSALEKGFNEYRGRVIAELGKEKDQEFRYASETKTVVDETEEGPKKVKVRRVSGREVSIYARFFDEYSTSWQTTPEYNRYFLQSQQNYANDLLRARGHIFLNEVYDMLGLERSKAGAVVGWLMSKDGTTANYVDFGIFDGSSPNVRDFVNGSNGSILLDFNVDGVIYDKLG